MFGPEICEELVRYRILGMLDSILDSTTPKSQRVAHSRFASRNSGITANRRGYINLRDAGFELVIQRESA